MHRDYGQRLDISGDLAAMTRFSVAVVTSGAKSILDVMATREVLESLGVPVVGYQTDDFPAFYQRKSEPPWTHGSGGGPGGICATGIETNGAGDRRSESDSRACRTLGRGVDGWLAEANEGLSTIQGRDTTPALLGRLHALSDGRTLEANLELVRNNVRLPLDWRRAFPSFLDGSGRSTSTPVEPSDGPQRAG